MLLESDKLTVKSFNVYNLWRNVAGKYGLQNNNNHYTLPSLMSFNFSLSLYISTAKAMENSIKTSGPDQV